MFLAAKVIGFALDLEVSEKPLIATFAVGEPDGSIGLSLLGDIVSVLQKAFEGDIAIFEISWSHFCVCTVCISPTVHVELLPKFTSRERAKY